MWVREGMERMASYWFADYPVRVATKTGTPQFYGEYTNSTFISFAPADDPQIAVAVVVEKGGGVPCRPIVKTSMTPIWFWSGRRCSE